MNCHPNKRGILPDDVYSCTPKILPLRFTREPTQPKDHFFYFARKKMAFFFQACIITQDPYFIQTRDVQYVLASRVGQDLIFKFLTEYVNSLCPWSAHPLQGEGDIIITPGKFASNSKHGRCFFATLSKPQKAVAFLQPSANHRKPILPSCTLDILFTRWKPSLTTTNCGSATPNPASDKDTETCDDPPPPP